MPEPPVSVSLPAPPIIGRLRQRAVDLVDRQDVVAAEAEQRDRPRVGDRRRPAEDRDRPAVDEDRARRRPARSTMLLSWALPTTVSTPSVKTAVGPLAAWAGPALVPIARPIAPALASPPMMSEPALRRRPPLCRVATIAPICPRGPGVGSAPWRLVRRRAARAVRAGTCYNVAMTQAALTTPSGCAASGSPRVTAGGGAGSTRRSPDGGRTSRPTDRTFDERHGTDTAGLGRARPARDRRRRDPGQAILYLPSPVRVTQLDARQRRRRPAERTFVDLGCGKGRVLLVAAQRPFRRVVGIEISDAAGRRGRRRTPSATSGRRRARRHRRRSPPTSRPSTSPRPTC